MIKNILENNEHTKSTDKDIAILKQYFPGCFNEDGSFDVVKLQNQIQDNVDVSKEGFELNFLGKSYAKLLSAVDTTTVIKPDLEHNLLPENKDSENIYISGDNLDALKHLIKSYKGKVKCIYIDPPYNTGSDGFVYNDNFNFSSQDLQTKLSITEDEANKILNMTSKHSSSHSAWLTFMYPRLKIARDLLSYDGSIFISIDDHEYKNIHQLCDYIFGEENYVETITISANPRGRDYGGVAKMHDYLLVYKKSNDTELNLIEDENGEFRHFDEYGGYELRELRNRNIKFNNINRPNLCYPFYVDTNKKDENGLYEISLEKKEGFKEVWPAMSQGIQTVWRWGQKKAFENLNINIKAKAMKQSDRFMIVEKYRESKKMARSIWFDKNVNTEKGTILVKELFNAKVFDYPKPIELIDRVVQMGTDLDSEDIVLDFFSGSASSAHAVFINNIREDKVLPNKFIMVQLPEKVKEKSIAQKEGYETIDQIGQARIQKAAKKIQENNLDKNMDYGFKHFTLVEPSKNTLDKMLSFDKNQFFADETILSLFGEETVLATWLNDDGYGLTGTAEIIDLDGYKAYYKGNHLYLINSGFENKHISALFEKYNNEKTFNPENIILFGYSFNMWSIIETLKTNIKQLKSINKNVNVDVRY